MNTNLFQLAIYSEPNLMDMDGRLVQGMYIPKQSVWFEHFDPVFCRLRAAQTKDFAGACERYEKLYFFLSFLILINMRRYIYGKKNYLVVRRDFTFNKIQFSDFETYDLCRLDIFVFIKFQREIGKADRSVCQAMASLSRSPFKASRIDSKR